MTSARNELKYLHKCKMCFAALSTAKKYELVRQESEACEAKMAIQQAWNGSEPALQILVLPRPMKLPAYADVADYLHPSHCHLCLQPVEDLVLHLHEEHQAMSLPKYRQDILSATVAVW